LTQVLANTASGKMLHACSSFIASEAKQSSVKSLTLLWIATAAMAASP
jgi:hypothetical protein